MLFQPKDLAAKPATLRRIVPNLMGFVPAVPWTIPPSRCVCLVRIAEMGLASQFARAKAPPVSMARIAAQGTVDFANVFNEVKERACRALILRLV